MTRRADIESVVFYFARAAAAYQAVLIQELRATGLDEHLGPGMGNVLFALFEADGRTLTEICELLGMAKSTMTGIVSRMVDGGIIVAEADPDDARAKRLYLTKLGRSLEPRCRVVTRRLDEVFTRGLNRREHEQFLGQLQQLLARLTRASF